MRKIIIGGLILVISIFSISCAKKGFDRGAIKEGLYSTPEITDDEIKRILSLKPQIKFPFKIGIYYSESCSSRYRRNDIKWQKDDQDVTWLNQLISEGIISEVVPITYETVSSYEGASSLLKIIRLAAARHNVDAVLIVDYNYEVDRYNNFSAFLYLTIIGAYLVPGTHSDVLVIMNGALWDVRNEYLYLTAEVEGDAQKMGPAFILEDKDSVNLAKEKALNEFKDEILRRIRNLKGPSS